jgi:ATP-dependent helicase/nuclease subunit B
VATLPGVSAHSLVTGPFAALETKFLAAVGELKRNDPLRPLEVLVGSNLLAVYLRRLAASRMGAVANLRFLTFLDLARAIAPAEDGRPPLPALGARLLARRALLETPEAAAFGPLSERDALAAALLSTADDLRDAGIAPGEIRGLLGGASELDDRRRQLRALAAVLSSFEESRRRFRDATSLLERAADARLPPSDEPLLVYGLYDLGGLRERLLAVVAAGRPVFAFVPDDGQPEPGEAPRARRRLFEGLLGVPAETLRDAAAEGAEEPRIVVAPSDGAEAREVVREILRAVEDGIPLHRIAVLVRNPERQEPALTTELDLRNLPYFRPAGPGFSRSPLGRAARALLHLTAGDFQRDAIRELFDLLENLGLLPAVGLAGLSPPKSGDLLSDLGFTSGHESLLARLDSARERLDRPFDAADDPDGRFAARRAREREGLDLLRNAVTALDSAAPSAGPGTWAEWAERLRRSFDAFFGTLPERERLERAVEALEELEVLEPGASVEAAALAPLLAEALDLSPELHGRFERDGISLLSAVSARGLLFDAVLVPGLVEQSFPRPVRPDPLLFDAERKAIATSSGRPLPTRADERPLREERFLFWLARSSAKRRLVLLAAARDVATDRPRLLSPYLLDLAGGAAREALRDRELGRFVPLPEEITWLPAFRPLLEGPPVDAEEALRRALSRSPALRRALPESARAAADALARAAARRRPFFTEYEGKTGRPASGLLLRGRIVSASRLERFATCAYRAFLERGLHLEAVSEADDESPFGLDPLARGSALHAAVRDLTRSLLGSGRTFADLRADEIPLLAEAAARRAVGEAVGAAGTSPPPVLVEIEIEALRALLESLFSYLTSAPPEPPPAGAEVRFGPANADPADRDEDRGLSTSEPVPVPGLPFDVRLSGRIDRLDRDGGRARVVDYKTGKPEPYKEKNRKGHAIAGGERLQLPVYALAARHLGASRVASAYLFVRFHEGEPKVTETAFGEDETGKAVDQLKDALVLMDEAIGSGFYLPKTTSFRSAHPCGFCDFAAICGPGHERLYERKWQGEADGGSRNPLLKLMEIP